MLASLAALLGLPRRRKKQQQQQQRRWQRPSSGVLSPPPPVAALPSDCLAAIVACFPRREDALHLRLVCRAWRDAFNANVTRVTVRTGLMPKLVSAFPSLAHLVVQNVVSADAAAAALRLLALPRAGGLTTLEVVSCALPAAAVSHLSSLTSLRTLVISNSNVKSIAAAQLHTLPSLEVLELPDNALAEVPSALGSVADGGLRRLDLSGNDLAAVPESIGGCSALQSLRLSSNLLTELPDTLSSLTALTSLDVSFNRLKATLPDGLAGMTQLRQLSLYAAFSHSLRNEASPSVRALAQLTLDAPPGALQLHVEEPVMGLVRLRRRQLAAARAVTVQLARAQRDADAQAATAAAMAAAAGGLPAAAMAAAAGAQYGGRPASPLPPQQQRLAATG